MIYRKIKIYRNHRQMTSSLLSANIYQPFPGRKSNCAPQGAISATSCFGLQPETRLTKLLKISTPKSHLITKRKSQADCWMVYEPRKHGLDENGLLKTYVLLMGWYNARNYNGNVPKTWGEFLIPFLFISRAQHGFQATFRFSAHLLRTNDGLRPACCVTGTQMGQRVSRRRQPQNEAHERIQEEIREETGRQ